MKLEVFCDTVFKLYQSEAVKRQKIDVVMRNPNIPGNVKSDKEHDINLEWCDEVQRILYAFADDFADYSEERDKLLRLIYSEVALADVMRNMWYAKYPLFSFNLYIDEGKVHIAQHV